MHLVYGTERAEPIKVKTGKCLITLGLSDSFREIMPTCPKAFATGLFLTITGHQRLRDLCAERLSNGHRFVFRCESLVVQSDHDLPIRLRLVQGWVLRAHRINLAIKVTIYHSQSVDNYRRRAAAFGRADGHRPLFFNSDGLASDFVSTYSVENRCKLSVFSTTNPSRDYTLK